MPKNIESGIEQSPEESANQVIQEMRSEEESKVSGISSCLPRAKKLLLSAICLVPKILKEVIEITDALLTLAVVYIGGGTAKWVVEKTTGVKLETKKEKS